MTAACLSRLSGISRANICHYEHGQRQPAIDTIRTFALTLDISADFLLDLTDDASLVKRPERALTLDRAA